MFINSFFINSRKTVECLAVHIKSNEVLNDEQLTINT